MKTVTFEGTIESYQGKTLDSPIKYSGSCEQYENLTEAKDSEDWPGDSEILKFVNTKKLTAAKAKNYQDATKDLKAAWESSPEYQRESLVKNIMTAKDIVRSEAEALADTILGA